MLVILTQKSQLIPLTSMNAPPVNVMGTLVPGDPVLGVMEVIMGGPTRNSPTL